MADRTFLDWPFFEPRHRDFADGIAAFADDLGDLAPGHADVDASCREIARRLGAGGWTANAVGDALDVRTLCLAREILAYRGGLADFAFAMQGLGSGPITLFGTNDQKRDWLPRVARGEAIAAFALSEPEAGSDVAALKTTATPDGGDFVIAGEKTWISNGGIADFYCTFARTGEAPGAKGLSCFLIPAETPGLTVAERIETSAPHPLARLRFEDARVPASARIGGAGEGFKVAMSVLDIFRSTVGAAALGFARRALDEASGRAATRRLFGGTLGDLQMVQAMLADMATAVDAAALMVYRAAWTKDAGAPRVTRESAMAKLHATETAQRVVDQAVQIMGGHGVVLGNPVERLYRDVRALRIYEGASEVQKVVIARQHLAAYAERANAKGVDGKGERG
ncbi:acyl-CoA dehydrogenase family protein [Marivibrio halodurans]|uniref:Acyl-CoA dehydrogenase family protein n=1 Tax=Marivibrio halodurans TaxID=2039722 RepID=A0A8J7V2D8_9PROT|nr:acyl-CoA dehydrogenase family protein [Marivibrio halodurans]MBP5857235.1 acyl-CoA dehydrogenase family protein [Marivibrio halodurans]